MNRPTRRTMLKTGLGWAAAPALAAVAKAGTVDTGAGRSLVLLHLAGGNDGLNTIIPYADPLYRELRPRLRVAAEGVLPIDGRIGFHRSLAALVPLFERGHLAIVQGVGYPDPDYSHVGSYRIWSTGLPSQMAASARAARVGDTEQSGESSARGYRPGSISRTLADVACLIASQCPPELVFATVHGFDTHTDQLRIHPRLLRELGDSLAAFQRQMEMRGLADRVTVMVWSEFGRRPAENATGGTDHGSAGPVFVLGRKVRGGLYGQPPSLKDTDFGNLISTVYFRNVHATLASSWLRYPGLAMVGADQTLALV